VPRLYLTFCERFGVKFPGTIRSMIALRHENHAVTRRQASHPTTFDVLPVTWREGRDTRRLAMRSWQGMMEPISYMWGKVD
jgi:hypothetical protein